MGKYQRSDCAYSVSALVLDPCNFSSSEKEELCPALIATCWALLLLSITLCVSGWSNRLIDLVPGVGEQHATRPETKTKQLRSQRLEVCEATQPQPPANAVPKQKACECPVPVILMHMCFFSLRRTLECLSILVESVGWLPMPLCV